MTGGVTVTGVASRAVAPGTAAWRADAVEADDDPRAAFERCSARLNALVERLAAVGEVATDAVVVRPRWTDEGAAGSEAVGGVRVWCPAARAGEVAQAAMTAGASRLHGPRFQFEGEDAVREELLAEAVANARRKAERLAAAAGRRLGAVRRIQECEAGHAVAELSAASPDFEPPDVRPRDRSVAAAVTVEFALEG